MLAHVDRKTCWLRTIVILSGVALAASSAPSWAGDLVQLAGTPEQIGAAWGEINRELIVRDMDQTYLQRAAKAGISRDMLLERSAAYVRIVERIAPHWLDEARATARTVGIDEALYVAFIDGQSRNRFLHDSAAAPAPRPPVDDNEIIECTSYAVSRAAAGGAILFHKTRDNIDRPQVAPIVDSSLEGINKFLAVTDASRIRCSMMVNDKGLAGSGDYPADRKKDSSTLELPPADPQYQGLMAGSILRYIAERASTCGEALAIIEDFVARGYYAGGDINASHWLFVDRHGEILEVCNNSRHVVSKVHTQKVYFSRLNNSAAAQQLRESAEPIDFPMFRNAARDSSICFGTSISGLTVEIDPDHPDLFTCAWISLPVRGVAFPVLMGQSRTPAYLVDGSAYRLGGKCGPQQIPQWEKLERSMHAGKQQLQQAVAASVAAGNPRQAHVELLEQWSGDQAAMLVETLRQLD